MNAKFLLSTVAGMLFTLSVHAHDCSGGTDGGMDATGNQCNDVAAVATDVSSSRPTSPPARSLKAETNKTPAVSKSADKRTVVTRHTPALSQIKHNS